MKKWILPIMLGFGITLALIIGQRMSTDAMAVVIGVAVGVAASVPTSLLLVALLRRERSPFRSESQLPQQPPAYPQLQQPNIIVLNPADLLGQRGQQPMMPLLPPQYASDGGLRRLRVVGDEEE
jgi:hypothetical protein